MGMEFRDGRYLSTVWFVGGKEFDWLCYLYRDPGGKWMTLYRFRYDAEPGETEDRRNWYCFEHIEDADKGEAYFVEHNDGMAHLNSLRLGKAPIHKLLVRSDKVDVQMAAMQREEWCHITTKEIKETDAKNQEGGSSSQG